MEGVLSEPSVPRKPEETHEASGAHATSPPPRSVRLAIACSVIALKNCKSNGLRQVQLIRGFCFEI
jgi:hypothetical protein